ncbi:ribosomal subunit interface protein [Rubidibacter lacunae KORDI 51-2]|uniref:Ribosome hibernation promoting factor n=1 Tax=Rubidibacter lacunae KORDI 51-2 TaxID=582515 RepID=U5DPY8_9CHRO|nr:ribosome-associated translation inhibitor RaiA [Rubidibacter lacunae]ERN41765.1 ribosomal subunit interface protein [Rubidibacter lacunae KORDI 51-2]
MKFSIQGKNVNVTSAVRDHIEKKMHHAIEHFQGMTSKVDVNLSVERNPRIEAKHITEVTVRANGKVIRACVDHGNLYASIDLAADKISRQLRKYKERNLAKIAHGGKTSASVPTDSVAETLIGNREPQLPSEVVRTKYFAMPPMNVADALEQLQLVDHDFFVFRNETTDEINVIYERNHGGYGVIQPRNGNGHTHGNHADRHVRSSALNGNGHAAAGETIDFDMEVISDTLPPAQV